MSRSIEGLARGAVVQSTLDFLQKEVGDEGLDRILAQLDPDTLEAVRASGSADEIPLRQVYALWNAAHAELIEVDPNWMERAGAFSIESAGRQQYGGIVGKPSPLEFLTQRISLFRLFYRSGSMEVVRHDPGEALLRLVDFGPADPLFCQRQTGGLRRALALARGGEPRVRHVRCIHEGDAFCEWALRWDE